MGLHYFMIILKKKIKINYTGLDTDNSVINYCRKKNKNIEYYNFDILKKNNFKKNFDCVFADRNVHSKTKSFRKIYV